VGSYRDLEVWLAGRKLVADVYRISRQMPEDERFGLILQMRRAAVSIPSNIAEGSGRKTDPAFRHHLKIALGSLFELETMMLLCSDLGFVDEASTDTVMHDLRSLGIKIQNLISVLNGVREETAEYGCNGSDLSEVISQTTLGKPTTNQRDDDQTTTRRQPDDN
jgi:four helix bundle protein